ncbi:hypothetical protein, partial [Trichococcus alkaliphilus]|uniref:hypothetical protein n=1 Tax=Trichococcus alkaliphilus TaxID=2052943 RepID=UPI0019610DEC
KKGVDEIYFINTIYYRTLFQRWPFLLTPESLDNAYESDNPNALAQIIHQECLFFCFQLPFLYNKSIKYESRRN